MSGSGTFDMGALTAQMAALTSSLQRLTRASDAARPRKAEDAVLLDGACPPSLRACDPEEEARRGRTCPDFKKYAPDPLIVDEEGHICYAPADLEKWAGKASMGSVDNLIERGAAELFGFISRNDALLDKVKSVALQAAVIKVTKPQVLGAAAAPGGAFDMSNRVIQAQELNNADLQDGLRAAQSMYAGSYGASVPAARAAAMPIGLPAPPAAPAAVANPFATGASPFGVLPGPGTSMMGGSHHARRAALYGGYAPPDWVFHEYTKPMADVALAADEAAAGLVAASASDVNADTIAFAGAHAWAQRADAVAAAAGADKLSRFSDLVRDLPGKLQGMMNAAALRSGAPASLKNLTFRQAWPLIMTGRIGVGTLIRAAAKVTSDDLMEAAGEADAAKFNAAFAAKTAGQQWADMVAAFTASR